MHVIMACNLLPFLNLGEECGDRRVWIVGRGHAVVIILMIAWSKVAVEPNETIDVFMECALPVPGWSDEKRFEVGGIEGS